MADKKRKAGEKTVKVDTEAYRSLILGKLRAEIAAKRAAFELASRLDAEALPNLAYYKMKYYKMAYWKRGHERDFGQEVINPVKPKGPQ